MNYKELNETDKRKVILNEYIQKKRSLADIASEFNTYANQIRRDAKKYGIAIRNKSQAQKNALNNGTHKHPTKGTQRSKATKTKIGKGLLDSWQSMSQQEKNKRKNKAKIAWESKTPEEKNNILRKANEAVRESSKTGSKLEKFLLNKLISLGMKTEFHKEQVLANTKLQIDIFLPTIATAIEVDGPSHFLPVWGDEALKKNQEYDKKKSGLILGKGLFLIRIKQQMDFSVTRAEIIGDKLCKIISEISDNSKNRNHKNRIIEIGDTDD